MCVESGLAVVLYVGGRCGGVTTCSTSTITA